MRIILDITRIGFVDNLVKITTFLITFTTSCVVMAQDMENDLKSSCRIEAEQAGITDSEIEAYIEHCINQYGSWDTNNNPDYSEEDNNSYDQDNDTDDGNDHGNNPDDSSDEYSDDSDIFIN